jgi:hypothetical protein
VRDGYGRSVRVADSPRANCVLEYIKETFGESTQWSTDKQGWNRTASSESRTEIARKVSADFNVRAIRQAKQVVPSRQRV